MAADGCQHFAVAQNRGENPLADDRVLFHQVHFIEGQHGGLVEHDLRDADLADVVQPGRETHMLMAARLQVDGRRQGKGKPADAAEWPAV